MAVLIVAAAAGAVVLTQRRKAASASAMSPESASAHRAGLEWAYAPRAALLDAPPGKTPCETGYNAATAEHETAQSHHRPSIFSWIAPREDFLTACATLTPDQQQCVVPAYATQHRDQCAGLRPPADVLDKMFKVGAASQP